MSEQRRELVCLYVSVLIRSLRPGMPKRKATALMDRIERWIAWLEADRRAVIDPIPEAQG